MGELYKTFPLNPLPRGSDHFTSCGVDNIAPNWWKPKNRAVKLLQKDHMPFIDQKVARLGPEGIYRHRHQGVPIHQMVISKGEHQTRVQIGKGKSRTIEYQMNKVAAINATSMANGTFGEPVSRRG